MSIYTPATNYPYTTSAYYGYQGYGRPSANQWMPRQSYTSTSPNAQFAPIGSLMSSVAPMVQSAVGAGATTATETLLPKALAGLAGLGVAGGSVWGLLKSKKAPKKAANEAQYTPPVREVSKLPVIGPQGAYFKNGLHITTQRHVDQGGGLGIYCYENIEAFNRMGFDVRSISPYNQFEKALDESLPEHQRSTVVGQPLKVQAGEDEYALVLRKRFTPGANAWAYLVECDDLFMEGKAEAKLEAVKAREIAKLKAANPGRVVHTENQASTHSYSGSNSAPGVEYRPASAEADTQKKWSYLNLAAKHFLFDQRLGREDESKAKGKPWTPTVLLLNEFSGSEIVGQMTDEQRHGVASAFIVHNQHDGVTPMDQIPRLSLKIPQGMENLPNYSRADVGLRFADRVLATVPYAQRLAEWIPGLKQHFAQNTVVNMYHGCQLPKPLAGQPVEALGFKMLPNSFVFNHADPKRMYSPEQIKAIQAFKGPDNKRVFQKMYAKGWESKMPNNLLLKPGGYLKEDPKAVLYTMISRVDPYQKGWLNTVSTLRGFLKANPHAQVFLGGTTSQKNQAPILQHAFDKLTKDPELAGRVVIYTDWVKGNVMDSAMTATDFDIHPSLFEPFGTHNFRVGQWGGIPVMRNTDGLAVTSYDPEVSPYGPQVSVAKEFGQTAVLAPAINDLQQQSNVLNKLIGLTQALKPGEAKKKRLLTAEERAVLEESNRTLRHALDRSIQLASDPEKLAQVRLQGMNYVYTKHYQWEDVIRSVYIPTFNEILQEKAEQQAKLGKQLRKAA